MIDGIRIQVTAQEMRSLLSARADHHEERAAFYKAEAERFEANKVESMNYTNGDPTRQLKEKHAEHEGLVPYFRFCAEHVPMGEAYELDEEDLRTLGICPPRRYN